MKHVLKSGTQSLSLVLIMLGIVFFINILSNHFFVRADLTDNKEYTITESTKKILSGIDDVVNIRLYFSENLPPYVANIRNQVKDLLDEYNAYAKGNLSIQFLDPAKDPDLKKKVQRLGIPELQLAVFEKDQRQVRKVYLGISVQYGDKSEVIPVVKNLNNLEYDLTSAIFKVTDPDEHFIGWVGIRDTGEDANGYNEIIKNLDEQYKVRMLKPETLSQIPKNIDLIIVDGNRTLNEKALYAIDQHIMRGGKAIFIADTVSLNKGSLSASVQRQDVADLLEHYGIGIKPELILDRSNAYASFNSGFVRFSVPYPFWPKIKPSGFNKDIPAVSQLESMVFPWVSPLDILAGDSEQLTITPLVNTSKGSWTMEEPFDLNPNQRFDLGSVDFKPQTVAVMVKGKMESFFKDKPVPQDSDKPSEEEEKKKLTETDKGQIVVVSNSRFVNNQFLQIFPENLVFMQNVIDTLVIGDALIGIRSRAVTERPLDFKTSDEKEIERTKLFHRILGTFGVPVLLILFGLARFSMHRKRRRSMASASIGG